MAKIKCSPLRNGKRVFVRNQCNYKCKHFKECCKELELKKLPRDYHKAPASDIAIKLGFYLTDYIGRKYNYKINPEIKI
jgi:hypothetical protein